MCGLCMTVDYFCMWCQIVSDWKGKAIKIQLLSAVKQLLYTMWKALLSSFFPSPLSILCPRRKHLPLSETVLPDEKNRPIQKHLRPLTMPRKDAIDILSLKAAKKDTTNYSTHVQSTSCTSLQRNTLVLQIGINTELRVHKICSSPWKSYFVSFHLVGTFL